MEPKFTQGEWEIRPAITLDENGKPLFYDITVDGGSFLFTHKNMSIEGMDDEQQLANAKLIASAPEMFAFLRDLYEQEQCVSQSCHDELIALLTKITK